MFSGYEMYTPEMGVIARVLSLYPCITITVYFVNVDYDFKK